MIKYADYVLENGIISDAEKRNFEFLKLFFKIKEGDFLKYKSFEIREILQKQFEKLYADNYIDEEEAKYSVVLQDIFDLSYGQFDAIKERFVLQSIMRGADVTSLDTANKIFFKNI